MDTSEQADSQAWSLWAKLTRPALLRCPVLGVSVVLVISTPLAASARPLVATENFASAQPTQRQLRVLRSYERYLSRMRAQRARAARAVKFAYRQIGKPYQWGGAGPRTYDCSGLAMAAWRRGGLSLPHRADLQHRVIRRKVGIKHLRPGDLVFFSGDHHVGIYVGKRHFLHAPHTGARVQRGTLSGWRMRVFAGAARPGAPAFHAWPRWVRSLARHLHGHGTPAAARPHKKGHATAKPAQAPVTDTGDLGAWPWHGQPPSAGADDAFAPDESGYDAPEPVGVPNRPAGGDSGPAGDGNGPSWADNRPAGTTESVPAPEGEHPVRGAFRPPADAVDWPQDTYRVPLLGGPIVWLTGRTRATEPIPPAPASHPATGPAGSTTRPTGAPPPPPPQGHGRTDSRSGAHHRWPPISVQQDHDRYDYDSELDRDEGDDGDQSLLPGLLRSDEQLPSLLKGL